MSTLRDKLARWADEWKLAAAGVGLACRSWKFDLVVLVVFVVFATFLNMLALPSSFQYLLNLPNPGRQLGYLGEMFLGVFGYNKSSLADFLPILLISILQALIIGLIAIVWWKRRRARQQEASEAAADSGANLSKAGIVTGLAVLAGGCPTCGTSLLAPVIGAIFSGSSAAVGNAVSWLLTGAAIVIALFSFKKVGLDAYVIIVSERRRNRKNGRKQDSKK